MQQLYKWSGLWRPITPKLLSNRLILICMFVAFLLAGAAYYLEREAYLPNAAIYGARIGLVVFVSWALARELQPDAPWAAFVVVGLTSAGIWFWPDPHLPLLFLLLLMLRVVTRTSGVSPTPADLVMLLAFTGWLLYQGHLLAGIMGAVAFWLNSRLPAGRHWHLYIALLLVAISLGLFGLNLPRQIPGELSIYTNMLTIALATGFALFTRKIKTIHSRDDAHGKPLNLQRIRSAQTSALLVATVFTLWRGDAYFNNLGPLWACFGGLFLYAVFHAGSPKTQI